jgi:gamma-glutamyltranspeptidase/glutathione hydrolase
MIQQRTACALGAALLAAACAGAPQRAADRGPNGFVTPAPLLDNRVVAHNGVVTSASGLASEAGLEVLRRGGNAVDAAVATGFAINVMEPMMSGVGGGGAMLIYMQRAGRAEYVDFYSAARAVTWRRPLPDTGTASLREVGVPGAVDGFLQAHRRYGRLPLADVMAPAIRLAEQGYPVNLVLHDAIASSRAKLERFPEAARRFLPNGEPLPVGTLVRQPELAATLRRIAAGGRDAFYGGRTGEAIVRLLNAGGNPVNLEDLAAFASQWDKRPVCTEYRGRVVLSAAPPQTGMRVLHALNLMEPHDLRALGLPTRSSEAFHVLVSALRLAAADFSRHNNDPNWVPVAANGLTSRSFAAERRSLVGAQPVPPRIEGALATAHDAAAPTAACARYQPYPPARSALGGPGAAPQPPPATPATPTTEGETTHISVVDAEGNAVALTNTLSPYFGSGAWVEGFFLNSSAFDFVRGDPSAAASSEWRVRPSTIAPTIVLEGGRVRAVIGSPGGGRIPGAIVQGLVYLLDYELDPVEAVSMPRVLVSPGSTNVELEHGFRGPILAHIRALGWNPVPQTPGYARLYAIARVRDAWIGAADPRHDGGVRGY